MCHLLQDSDTNVQLTSYPVIKEAAKKQTEHLVLEAAVDTESSMKFEIPAELFQMLQDAVDLDVELEEDEEGNLRKPGVSNLSPYVHLVIAERGAIAPLGALAHLDASL